MDNFVIKFYWIQISKPILLVFFNILETFYGWIFYLSWITWSCSAKWAKKDYAIFESMLSMCFENLCNKWWCSRLLWTFENLIRFICCYEFFIVFYPHRWSFLWNIVFFWVQRVPVKFFFWLCVLSGCCLVENWVNLVEL